MSLEFVGIFGAGLLTFVTPCVLPLIPIYLALFVGNAGFSENQKGVADRLALFFSTLAFSLGLLVVFVTLGLTATSIGALLTEYRTQLVLIGGLMIFLFGLKFAGVLKISWLDRERRLDDSSFKSRFRLINAGVMGVVFALGWTPCVGPILGSVLTYAASSASSPLQGAAYLAVYGLGFVMPLLVLSLFGDAARRIVRRVSPYLPQLERISAAVLVGAGLYLMLTAGAPPTAARSSEGAQMVQRTSIDPPLGQTSDRPRMVQFTSSRCSICRQMIPTVAVIERDCDGRRVDLVKIDVEKSKRLASSYRVRGVPTFIFLDTGGKEVARLVGYQTLASLRQSLSAVTGTQCDGLGHFDPGTRPAKNSTCGAAGVSAPLSASGQPTQCGS